MADLIFNVRGYGAKGDGSTLDTAAIPRALDAAHAAGGGTVCIAAGTYFVTQRPATSRTGRCRSAPA